MSQRLAAAAAGPAQGLAHYPALDGLRAIAVLLVLAVAAPVLLSPLYMKSYMLPWLIWTAAALGLNLLVGYCGQISLGTGGFMAVGAYAAYNLTQRIPDLNVVVAFILTAKGLGSTAFAFAAGSVEHAKP